MVNLICLWQSTAVQFPFHLRVRSVGIWAQLFFQQVSSEKLITAQSEKGSLCAPHSGSLPTVGHILITPIPNPVAMTQEFHAEPSWFSTSLSNQWLPWGFWVTLLQYQVSILTDTRVTLICVTGMIRTIWLWDLPIRRNFARAYMFKDNWLP